MFFTIKGEMSRVILPLHDYEPESVFWTGRLPMLPVLFYFSIFPFAKAISLMLGDPLSLWERARVRGASWHNANLRPLREIR